MTPAEQEVKWALADYVETSDLGNWVPSEVLWLAYNRNAMTADLMMNSVDFGKTLKRLYPRAARVRRRINGKPTYGWRCLKGPGTLTMNKTRLEADQVQEIAKFLDKRFGPMDEILYDAYIKQGGAVGYDDFRRTFRKLIAYGSDGATDV